MRPEIILLTILLYFAILFLIAQLTSRRANRMSFYTGNRKSPWYLVSFGMIGASLSGVTFISLPGEVGTSLFSYFQVVLGYFVGYFVIYTVLLPTYYKFKLISIYTYLEKRFGRMSYLTASLFFQISQIIGASLRFFLVVGVLQLAICDVYNIPFWFTTLITIALVLAYTYKSGIKTIVWTDSFQTLFMILSVILSIVLISDKLGYKGIDIVNAISSSEYSTIWDWEFKSETNFFKQFFSGVFICIVMTGLDQNMMQKNLTCRSLKDAQKNMFSLSLLLIPINLLFLGLGALLYIYTDAFGGAVPERTDSLFPQIAIQEFGGVTAIVFILGVIAAAFSSVDSSLTSVTTSFCIDFLKLNQVGKTQPNKERRTRKLVHVSYALVMALIIIGFHLLNSSSALSAIFKAAGYTYGPLLGLFTFGLYTNLAIKDKLVPYVAVLAPVLSYMMNLYSQELFLGYKFGFEIVIFNGLISFLLLWAISTKKPNLSYKEEHEKVWANKIEEEADFE